MKGKQKHYHPVIGIVILLVIAGLVAWYVRRPDTSTDQVDESAVVNHDAALETNSNGEVVPKLKNAINVTDQQADTSVDIDYFSLQNPGFVVIHAAEKGQPGKIVAKSGLLTAGSKQDLLIRLTTQPGMDYYAMLHADDGDGAFDPVKDQPIVGSDAKPVMDMFSILP